MREIKSTLFSYLKNKMHIADSTITFKEGVHAMPLKDFLPSLRNVYCVYQMVRTSQRWSLEPHFLAQKMNKEEEWIIILLQGHSITGKEITKFAYKHWENGMQRKDLSYSDLEESLNLGAFNELGRYLAFSKLWNGLKFMQ